MSKHATEIKVVGLSFRHVTEKLEPGDEVQLVPEPDNKYDPNALAVKTLDGEMLGYVGKKDKLRSKMLERAAKERVTLPVLIANYYEEGEDKLWESVEEGDLMQLWLRAYSRTPLDDDTFEEVESFTGEKVLWSEYQHVCVDMEGNELIGGSTYAAQFDSPFDLERISKAYAKKHELEVQYVQDYWQSLGDVASDYGSSVHRAMEHYCKFEELPRVPHLQDVVNEFLKVADLENCTAEPLITDTEMGMSGWVDILRTDGKDVWVEDYKTNTFNDGDYEKKWPKKLELYQHQLRYYGTILENFGYNVKGLTVWHWHNGRWDKHPFEFNAVKRYKREVGGTTN